MNDIVEFAKKNPKKFTSNGAGLYIGHHICYLQFQKAAGIQLAYIPEKAATDGMQNVLAGKVMATFANSTDAYRMRENFRVLAVADLERQRFMPDVPTFQKLGFQEIDNTSVVYRDVQPELESLSSAIQAAQAVDVLADAGAFRLCRQHRAQFRQRVVGDRNIHKPLLLRISQHFDRVGRLTAV